MNWEYPDRCQYPPLLGSASEDDARRPFKTTHERGIPKLPDFFPPLLQLHLPSVRNPYGTESVDN